MKIKSWLHLFIETAKEWNNDNIPHLSAALSYYAIFSLAPILVICIAVASFLIEQNKLQFALIEQINGTVGVSAGATILQLMNNIKAPTTNLIAFVRVS